MDTDDAKLGMRGSPHVPELLRESKISLALTTYQTNRLFLVGVKPNGTLSGFERIFDRPMGLHASADGHRLTMATRYQIREFCDPLPDGETYEGYDRVYVPRRATTTGEIDAHDLHHTPEGEILFINTQFSCLAALSNVHSFRPVWTPPFISQVSPEDRCHLNGLAMEEGQPRYATSVSRSDVAAGWRHRREEGGVVIDIRAGEVVASGLTMPHSPRVYDGELYLINAGTGDLGRVNRDTGTFEPIAFCPGFGRGLAFHEDIAIVSLSKPRGDELFQDLPLGRRLEEKDAAPRCGLFMIDLETGATAHWLEFTGGIVEELYDVQVLPNTVRPMALGFKTDEIRRFITFDHEDGPKRFQIGLEDPKGTDASAANQPSSGALPSLELPSSVQQSMRTKDTDSYRIETGTIPAEEALDQFGPLLLNRVSQKMESGQIEADRPLMIVVAARKKEAVGLAAARLHDDDETVELESLLVLPAHRGQGLATGLVEHLERLCAGDEPDKIKAEYRGDRFHQAALERIFEKRGWGAPQVKAHLYKMVVSDLVAHPALERSDPPVGEFLPWERVDETARKRIRRQVESGEIPLAASPFQGVETTELNTSLALRTTEGIQGWLIGHRLSTDIVKFGALYVAPSIRRQGVGLSLLCESAHRQHETTDAKKTLFSIPPQHEAALALVDDHLKPVIASHARRLIAGKRLSVQPRH